MWSIPLGAGDPGSNKQMTLGDHINNIIQEDYKRKQDKPGPPQPSLLSQINGSIQQTGMTIAHILVPLVVWEGGGGSLGVTNRTNLGHHIPVCSFRSMARYNKQVGLFPRRWWVEGGGGGEVTGGNKPGPPQPSLLSQINGSIQQTGRTIPLGGGREGGGVNHWG